MRWVLRDGCGSREVSDYSAFPRARRLKAAIMIGTNTPSVMTAPTANRPNQAGSPVRPTMRPITVSKLLAITFTVEPQTVIGGDSGWNGPRSAIPQVWSLRWRGMAHARRPF
jgi:hypothetical protein